MTGTLVWLAALFAPPLAVALLGLFELGTERLRAAAVAAAAVSLAAGACVFLVPTLGGLRVAWPWRDQAILGAWLLHVTELSRPLVALPAGLWLVTVAVTPRARLDRGGLERTALASACGTLAFLTDSPALLLGCWAASTFLFLGALSVPDLRRARRVAGGYLWVSTVLLCAGVAMMTLAGDGRAAVSGEWLVIVAVLIRKGIFPFHAWIPEAFDGGRLGPVVLFSAPQLGTYVAATLVVPRASPTMLREVAVLSLVTALYGAALAVFQRDARRAAGYLFVSQSALVLAGIDCTTSEALAGALVLWLSSALAFTGMARTILALEARRGRLDLRVHHGGFDQMPLLASSFLVLGLACTGFPGTLGFVGQEMLIDGAVRSFSAAGFLTVGAAALTGLAVLRMYFSLFCGRRGGTPGLRLRRREAIIFGAVATVLVVTGLAPEPIVRSRLRASDAILRTRGALGRRVASPGARLSSAPGRGVGGRGRAGRFVDEARALHEEVRRGGPELIGRGHRALGELEASARPGQHVVDARGVDEVGDIVDLGRHHPAAPEQQRGGVRGGRLGRRPARVDRLLAR